MLCLFLFCFYFSFLSFFFRQKLRKWANKVPAVVRNAADHRNSIFLENKTPFSWKLPLLLGTHHSRRDVIWCHVEIITGKRRLKYFLNNFSFEDVGRNACPKNLQPSTSHSIFHNCHRCGRIGLDYQPLLGKWEESGGNRSYGSIPVLFKYIKNLTKPVLLLVFVFSLTQSNAVLVFPQKRPPPSPPPPPPQKKSSMIMNLSVHNGCVRLLWKWIHLLPQFIGSC